MKTSPSSDRLFLFYTLARESHPQSYIALDLDTGKVLFHNEDHEKFNTALKSFMVENRKITPAIMFPEKEIAPAELFFEQALMLQGILSSA